MAMTAGEKVASDLGLGGGFRRLQLASHDLAAIWQKVAKNNNNIPNSYGYGA